MISTGETVNHVVEEGEDFTGLGRFAYQIVQGKHGHRTVFASGYRPNKSEPTRDDMKLGSVYVQHLNYLRAPAIKRYKECPRQAFITDLENRIRAWQTLGYAIAIGLDANEDVRNGKIAAMFARVNMQNAILSHHPLQSSPATYHRNEQREPIDAIFCTHDLKVVRAGYGSFGDDFQATHRFLWVDFTRKSVYGELPTKLYYANARRFSAKNTSQRRRYLRQASKVYDRGKIEALHEQLWRLCWSRAPRDVIRAAHRQLHLAVRKARKLAEKKTRKLKVGGVPYSPKLQQYRNKIKLWSLVYQHSLTLIVSQLKIRRLAKKLGIKLRLKDITSQEAEQKLVAAKKEYRKVVPFAPAWRREHLNSAARANAKEKGTKFKSEKKQLVQLEKSRQQNRRINSVLKKGANSMVTEVFYTDNQGNRQEARTQPEKEKACMNKNQQRFTQAFPNTPFTQPPLRDSLGVMPDEATISQVLNGEYEIPSGIDPFAAKLLEGMQMHPNLANFDPVSPIITTEQHIALWKKQRETTAAEPTGLGFHHLVAGAYNHNIAAIDATISSIPCQEGFSPDPWQVITDFQILKKLGLFDVEFMRTIQLMDSQFNATNKHFGREMMKHAEQHKALAKEQFGSHKEMSSAMAALGKVLCFDLWRQMRSSGWIICNDAKSCYDRILHGPAMIAMMRMGLPYTVVRCMFETLQQAVHHVRTAYGVSSKTYGGGNIKGINMPMHGIGQGNGAGPAIWAVISCLILEIMHKQGYVATFMSAISWMSIALCGFLFVDDADLLFTAPTTHQRGEEIAESAQRHLDEWEGLIRATGGALVPSKSFWYLVDFQWDGTDWIYRDTADMPASISVRNTAGTAYEELTRKNPNESEVTLGVGLAVDGNAKGQVAKLKDAVKDFVAKLNSGPMDRNDVWKSLQERIGVALSYPLTATQLTYDEWEKEIMSPLLQAVLPRAGFSRSMPRAVVFGPSEHQGLNFMHLWYKQELTHLQICLLLLNTDSVISGLLQQSFEALRLEVGYPGEITDAPREPFSATTTNSWVNDVWDFADRFGFQFRDEFPKLQPAREADQFLMKAFVDHGYDGLQLHKLNTCRQFLKVITLADITTGDGKRLTDEALAGEPSGTTWHHYNWPRNPAELSRSHWKLWEKALHQAFTSGNTSSTSLQEPLGSWLVDPSDSWQWFYDPTSNALYHKTDDDWQAYTPTSSRSTHSSRPTNKAFKLNPSIFIPPNIRSLEPATTRPLSSLHDSDTVIFTGSAQPHQPAAQQAEEPTLQPGMTLQEAVTMLPESEKWAVESCNIPENVDFVIAQAIRNGIAVAASDGSFDEATGIATSGYQLCSATTELQFDNSITGANQSPGEAEDQSSYRSELAGILGVLVMVQSLCTLYEIQEGAIEVALDNKSAAEQSAGDWLLRPRQRDYDMLLDIRSWLQVLPIQVNFRWVKGHQDSSPPSNGRELDAWAKMNITADALAGQFRLAIGQRYRPNIPFRYEKWTLWYEHKKLTHFHIPSMYAKVYTPCLAYYVQKHGLTEEMVTRQINWESLKHAMKRIPWGKQRWLVKFATGHCAVGRMEKRRQHQQHDNCPLCDQEDETTVHVLRCHDERARKHWAASLASLNKWMGDHKTKPTLQRGIITLLQGWYDDGTIHFPTGHFQDQQVRQALEEQANIGVYNLLLGRFSKQFIDIQSAYIRYIDKDSKMTGQTWSTAFLVELWNLPWEMWEHRNGILHGATNTPQQQRSVEELLLEVNAELEQGPDTLLVPDQQLMDRDPNTFQAMSIHQLKQWLLTVHQARMAYWAHQHTADNIEDQNPGPEHRTLREWLLSSSSNPATDNLTVEIPEDTPPSEDSAPAPPPPLPSQQVRQTNTRPSAVPRRLAKGLARSRKFFQNWQRGTSQSS
jgi:hypothetical protein